jgi:hypothetical protein
MHRKGWLAAGLAVVVAISVGDVGAAPGAKARTRNDGARSVRATVTPAVAEAPTAVGTLKYDNNVPFRRFGNTDPLVGNLFGPGVIDPHSIQAVSFRLAQNYATDAVMSIWDPDGMGGATRLLQTDITGLPNGVTMTVTMFTAMAAIVPVVGHNGSFIAGMHNTFYTQLGCPGNTMLNGTCDGVALTMGSNPAPPVPSRAFQVPLMGGQYLPPTTMVAAGVAAIPGTNAIFRVTGDNLPVELLDFGIK